MTAPRITDPQQLAQLESGHLQVADLISIAPGCTKSEYSDEATCMLNGGSWTDDIYLTTYARDITVSFSEVKSSTQQIEIRNKDFLYNLDYWQVNGFTFGKSFNVSEKFRVSKAARELGYIYFDAVKNMWRDASDATTIVIVRTKHIYSWGMRAGFVSGGIPDPTFFGTFYDDITPATGFAMVDKWVTSADLTYPDILTIGQTYVLAVDGGKLGPNGTLSLDSGVVPIEFGADGATTLEFVAQTAALIFSWNNAGAVVGEIATAGGAVIRNMALSVRSITTDVAPKTFKSSSELLQLPDISESAELELDTVTISIAANANNWLTDVQILELLQKPVNIWRSFIHQDTGEVIGQPVKLYSGVIVGGGAAVSADGEGAVVSLKIGNKLYMFDRYSGFQCNTDSHGAFYPGDTGFKNCTAIEVELNWP